jgi:predicted lipid-binding transport protein (Tim44 family)
MKRWLFALVAAVLTASVVIEDAEARRLGGGRPIGAQRQAVPDKPATPPAAQQAAPATNPAAAAPARKPMSPWLGALAGLAAGLGLAYLFGEQLGAILMGILLAVAAVAVIGLVARALLRPRTQSAAAPPGMQYATFGRETVAAPPPSQATGGVAEPSFRGQFTPKIPEGFNRDAFVREAKKSFLALQEANDRGNVESIRELVTDEMFEHLKRDIVERGAARQETDVVTLNAELLEVVTESGMHWASIRFTGLIREEAGAAPQNFAEIWNLQKPEAGGAGWMLAGIQQVN